MASFKISELSTMTKSDLITDFRTVADDVIFVGFSLLLPLRLRVRVVNGETISSSLDVSTSMFIAERATCERLADLPIYARDGVSEACDETGMNGRTMSGLLGGLESLLWHPVRIVQGFRSKAPDICVRSNHPANQLLNATRHLVAADPFTTNLTGLSFPMAGARTIELTVRAQYFSKSSFVENCSPSTYSNGVRPIRTSKNVIPSDQTSDLRVSW